MSKEAKLELEGKTYTLPILTGSEGEKAVDVSTLRATTGHITIDDGYGNTGSCVSKVTFIDGDQGILRYRGIPIEDLAKESNFIETAYLIIYGELPNVAQLKFFSDLLAGHQFLHEDMKYHFEGFPTGAHPMAILSSMINAASCFDEGLMNWQWGKMKQFDVYVAKLISQVRTIAAYSYRKSHGLPLIYPKQSYKYTAMVRTCEINFATYTSNCFILPHCQFIKPSSKQLAALIIEDRIAIGCAPVGKPSK